MQILIAIAALCSVPTFRNLTEEQVLQCQKYYARCMKDYTHHIDGSQAEKLLECVENKKKLGGGE